MQTAIKKAKKLKKNPKLFFQDLKILNKKDRNVKDKNDSEPRVIGTLNTVEKITFELKDKAIKNKDFSTLMLVSGEVKSMSKAPIFGDMLKNENDFIGFREKALFGIRVTEDIYSFELSYEKLVHDKNWHSGVLSSFKNIILVGKYIKYAELFRSANINVRIIAIVTEKNDMIMDKIYPFIDHLICHKKHKDCNFKKDLTFFANTKSLLQAIEQRITQAGTKPYDYLVPVSGFVNNLSEIDSLNNENIDMVISLLQPNKDMRTNALHFSDYVDNLSKNIQFLLLKESWMQRYASYVSKQNTASLIKAALKDGARVKIL